jgi:hypothetical protein
MTEEDILRNSRQTEYRKKKRLSRRIQEPEYRTEKIKLLVYVV